MDDKGHVSWGLRPLAALMTLEYPTGVTFTFRGKEQGVTSRPRTWGFRPQLNS